MSLNKQEAQRLIERVGKLESQVASLNFKIQQFERIVKPEEILRRVREGEAEEKRKAESKDMLSAAELLQRPNP
jgi:cell division septum initiation protein DivIVA